MLNEYTIRNNILYLYFDFNYEFSSENFNKKKNKIKEIVFNIIKNNKMLFKITAVVLISGGIVFGNIEVKDINNNTIVQQIKLDNKIVEEQKDEVAFNNKQEINIVEEPKEEIKKQYIDNKPSKEENKIQEQNNNIQLNQEVIDDEIKEDNNIYVNVKRSNGDILKIELEEYIVGVVGAEMPASFHKEALKAQSIIARTYALKKIQRNEILSDNESTQSYKSIDELKKQWGSSFNTYYNKIKDVVDSTKGMYLTYNGTYIEAVYHSTSNGITEDSKNVWGNTFPYLISVDSPYDNTNPSFIISKDISYDELSNKLGIEVNIDSEINILGKTSGNRISEISINGTVFKGTDFRNKLGLRSADFDIEKKEEVITFTTRGYGHGVGLSQYGANGMAKNGSSYKDILFHYYKGVSIESI